MGRARLGRGAVAPRARGDGNQGGRNDFLRFQEQLLRRKKQKLFLGVSVGNGVRGGITLSSKSKKIFYAHKLFYCLESIFMPTNCTNGHESLSMGKMATCTVARICTNAMRDGCLGHVLWRSAFQAESMQSLPSLALNPFGCGRCPPASNAARKKPLKTRETLMLQ